MLSIDYRLSDDRSLTHAAVVAICVVDGHSRDGPGEFSAVARINLALGSRNGWTRSSLTWVSGGWTLDEDRASRWWWWWRGTTFVFSDGDQRARRLVASWSRDGHARFARSHLSGDGEARIGHALVLRTRTAIAWTGIGHATLTHRTGVRTTIGLWTAAMKGWFRAPVFIVAPFVFAAGWWFGQ
jgi:hypothetical protein